MFKGGAWMSFMLVEVAHRSWTWCLLRFGPGSDSVTSLPDWKLSKIEKTITIKDKHDKLNWETISFHFTFRISAWADCSVQREIASLVIPIITSLVFATDHGFSLSVAHHVLVPFSSFRQENWASIRVKRCLSQWADLCTRRLMVLLYPHLGNFSFFPQPKRR